MSNISGKVVATTGASGGIGEATALLLAERGANVVLGARRADCLEALAVRITKMGGEVAYAQTDVCQRLQGNAVRCYLNSGGKRWQELRCVNRHLDLAQS